MGCLTLDFYKRLIQTVSKIRIVETEVERNKFIEELNKASGVNVLTFINAHAVNLIHRDAHFWDALDNSTYILRDGIGLEILMKSIDIKPGLNLNGTDFIPQLLSCFRSKRIAIYGTSDPWLSNAVSTFLSQGYQIVDSCNGFLSDDAYIDRIYSSSPDLIVLAMGMPKQELLANKIKMVVQNRDVLVICGGAIVDFIGGRFPRAPLYLRKLHLEWLFRLMREPIRLFKRYVIGNFVFLLKVVRLKFIDS